jgi:hypothetical protein
MDETPSDSGASPGNASIWGQISEQIRRPAVWGLIALVAIVLAVQIWLLFL